jgi:hypothetical protein
MAQRETHPSFVGWTIHLEAAAPRKQPIGATTPGRVNGNRVESGGRVAAGVGLLALAAGLTPRGRQPGLAIT